MTFCQSCGIPLDGHEEWRGTEADGSPSAEYCIYCYKDGQFAADMDMEQMVAYCVPYLQQAYQLTEEEAEKMMRSVLPQLKRWETPTDRAALEAKADALLERCPIIVLSSITEAGFPRSCALVKVANEGFHKIWVATDAFSRKTTHFRANPKASICYMDGADGVTLVGTVRVLDEPADKATFWQDWMIEHFPIGMKDPTFCVLEFTTQEATFWIDKIFETYTY